MVTWPSAAMTTVLPRRTQITVVERMRGPLPAWGAEVCALTEKRPREAAVSATLRFTMSVLSIAQLPVTSWLRNGTMEGGQGGESELFCRYHSTSFPIAPRSFSMPALSFRDPHVIGTVAASVLCIGGAVTYLVLRRRPTAEEIERDRRAELVRSGRIMDGTILDISEFESASAGTGERADI